MSTETYHELLMLYKCNVSFVAVTVNTLAPKII